MREVIDAVRLLEVGEVQQYKNLAISPIIGNDSSLDYFVLSEVMGENFKIDEDPKSPTVPYLYVLNKTGKNVLAIAGDLVEGGRQNRALERNIYFDVNFEGKIPVKCIESGRWGRRYESREPVISRGTPSFKHSGTVSKHVAMAFSQRESWSNTDELLAESGVESGTQDLNEVYTKRNKDFKNFLNNFSLVENQLGIVAAFYRGGRKLFIADVFDRNSTFKKYFGNILRSHALDSGLDSKKEADLTKEESRGFLDSVDSCNFRSVNPVSLGKDFDMKKEDLIGSALVFDGNLVYSNLFTLLGNIPEKQDEVEERVSSGFQGGFERSILRAIERR